MAVLVISIPLCALMLFVGVRVLVVTRRAGGTTEQLVGDAFVLLGLGGLPGLLAGHGDLFAPSIQPTFFCAGQILMAGAFCCLYLFAWRCFGRATQWRKGLALTGIAGQVAGFAALGVLEGFEPQSGGVVRFVSLSRLIAIGWCFAESLHYWRLMRRRGGLGLADPVVTNRFALWCGWTGGLVAASMIVAFARFARTNITLDFSNPFDAVIIASTFAALVVSIISLTLAFLPPARYLDWVRRRADASSHA